MRKRLAHCRRYRWIALGPAVLFLAMTGLVLLARLVGWVMPTADRNVFVYVSRLDVRYEYQSLGRGRSVEISNVEVMAGSIDAGPPRSLSHDQAWDHTPALSPDGQLIAFSTDRYGNWDIALTDLNGSPVINLTRHLASDLHPTWSPDGRWIAFLSNRTGGAMGLYLLSTDWQEIRHVAESMVGIYNPPAWSPDSTRLAFSISYWSDGQPYNHLYTTAIDGGEPFYLTTHDEPIHEIAWSPDGRQIAYTTGGWQNVQLYLIDAAGGNQRTPLLDAEWHGQLLDYPSRPQWSPDSRFLLFQAWVNDSLMVDLFTLDLMTGHLRNLTISPGNDSNGVWSPDGRQVLFQSWRKGDSGADVYRLTVPGDPDLPGMDVRRLTDYAYDDWEPLWLPDPS